MRGWAWEVRKEEKLEGVMVSRCLGVWREELITR